MSKYMTLIFDDGPKYPLCEIVDKFNDYGFKAAFAIVGKQINDETEKMLKYAIDNGFELVSHGQNHISLSPLKNKQQILDELLLPIKEVEKRLDYKITSARLPFLAYNDDVLQMAETLKLPLFGSGCGGGRDWAEDTTPEIIANATLSSACDGAIGCLHVTEKTLKALDLVLPELKNRGYILTTPKELFKIKGINNIPLGFNIDNINFV